MINEIKYPIYSFSARWSQDGIWDEKYPLWYEGLPEGRIWNSTGFSKMFKEEQSEEQLDVILKDWWKNMLIEKNKPNDNGTVTNHPIINPEIDYLKARYKCHETWVLTWFTHETFDIGQTDEEVIKSFERYIRRVEERNWEIERTYSEDDWYKNGHETLMGAEDRWRWRGGANKDDENDPYPCRCEHCKKQGVLRIAH